MAIAGRTQNMILALPAALLAGCALIGLACAPLTAAEPAPRGRKPDAAPTRVGGEYEVTLNADYGFSPLGLGKAGRWTPLRVRVDFRPRRPARVLAGKLLVLPGPLPQECRYVHPLRMVGRGSKIIEFYILPMGYHCGKNGLEFTVELRCGEATIARALFEFAPGRCLLGADTRLVLCPITRGRRPPPVVGVFPSPRESEEIKAGERVPLRVQPAFLPLASLPRAAVGYDGVDSVAWYDPRPSLLSTEQANALREFVLAGGHLLLAAAATSRLTSAQWPGLPARFTQPITVELSLPGEKRAPPWIGLIHAGALIAGDTTSGYRLPAPAPRPAAAGLAPIRGRILARDGRGRPLLVRSRYGRGRITMLGLDINDASLTTMRRLRADILARALDLPQLSSHASALLPPPNRSEGKIENNTAMPPTAMERIAAVLQGAAALKPIPLWFVVLFLVAFFLLAGPVNYLVLKARRRLTLTWLCFGLTSIAFTACTYAGAVALKGTSGFLREVEVVDLLGNGNALRSDFFSIFAARPRPVRFACPPGGVICGLGRARLDGRSVLQHVNASELEATPGAKAVLQRKGEIMPLQVDLRQWQMDQFMARSHTRTTWGLAADLRRQGIYLRGTVRNPCRRPYERVFVLSNNSVYDLGPLAPGAARGLRNRRQLLDHVRALIAERHKPDKESQLQARDGILLSFPLLVRAAAARAPAPSRPPSPAGAAGSDIARLARACLRPAARADVRPLSDWRVLAASSPRENQQGLDLTRELCAGRVVLLGLARGKEKAGNTRILGMRVKRTAWTLVRAVVTPAPENMFANRLTKRRQP